MKKTRQELEQYLLERCEKIALINEQINEMMSCLLEMYNIPKSMTSDMITRQKINDKNDFELFCLVNGIEKLYKETGICEEFFTEHEIRNYKTMKYEVESFKFPIVIDCLQVMDGQWIGHTDTNFFIMLRMAQKINYNEKTQRILTRKIKNGEEYWDITLHESNVNGIRQCLREGKYIPTPITLNIPYESDADFYFDKEKKQLVINSLDAFDIADGYHRYVAMYREKDDNPDFNYPWELRIINFPEAKARFFVYQENQKTQMKKLDAKTMDSYDAANIVAKRLNGDMSFNMYNEIDDKNGKIDLRLFSKCVHAFYFKDMKTKPNNADYNRVAGDIKNKFNHFTNENEEYLDIKYTYSEIMVLIFVFSQINDFSILNNCVNHLLINIHRINKAKINVSKNITKKLIDDLEKLLEEVK